MDLGIIIPLFATPVVKVNINRSFTESEMQCIADIPLEKKNKYGKILSSHRSENYDLFEVSPNLKDIKSFCELQLKQYMEHIEGADIDKVMLRITQSWLHNTKPGESQHSHTHPNSHLAGVLYISCLPNDHINFENRLYGMFNNLQFPTKKSTPWNANIMYKKIDVEEGDLILFPSWMVHSVDVNDTEDKERISLAFNTFPIGEMGYNNNITHLFLQ